MESAVKGVNPDISVGELIGTIARALVDKPEEVSVTAIVREADTLLQLRVDPSDVGKIVGKQGRTARSLRTILGAVSVKLHHRYSLEIIEPVEAAAHPVPRSVTLSANS